MIEELLYQKTEHDQVKRHRERIMFFQCFNCVFRVRFGNYQVGRSDSMCPCCGHALTWSRVTPEEVDRILQIEEREKFNFERKIERLARVRRY